MLSQMRGPLFQEVSDPTQPTSSGTGTRSTAAEVHQSYLSLFESVLKRAIQREASDIFIAPNFPISLEVKRKLEPAFESYTLDAAGTAAILSAIKEVDPRRCQHINREIEQNGQTDFSWAYNDGEFRGRFRVNVGLASGAYTFVARLLPERIKPFSELNLPSQLLQLAGSHSGLIIIAGQVGSGKSTTAASLIDHYAKTQTGHIVTIENPIEFKIKHGQSIVTQREVGSDVPDFAEGLRGALRQRPKVILIGEMRDTETMETALTAAETGSLVISTLHTRDVAHTIQRILSAFPDGPKQTSIRASLADSILCVCCQQLIPNTKEGVTLAHEFLVFDHPVRTLLREGKEAQLVNNFKVKNGDQRLDDHLKRLVLSGDISYEEGHRHAIRKNEFAVGFGKS